MPPVLVAFFILLGGSTVPGFVKALVTRPDPTAHSKLGKPVPLEYRTWTSSVTPGGNACTVTYFAAVNRNKLTRLIHNGQEQPLDTAWAFDRELRVGERRIMAFEFRDPVTRAKVACQEVDAQCGEYVARETREGSCSSGPVVPATKSGKHRLEGHVVPALAQFNSAIGGAWVDVEFSIQGNVTEQWYCPSLTVYWPDETKTFRESDCAPFEERDKDQRFKWKFSKGFPGGEWNVRGCIEKSGKVLACETVKVRVVGGE